MAQVACSLTHGEDWGISVTGVLPAREGVTTSCHHSILLLAASRLSSLGLGSWARSGSCSRHRLEIYLQISLLSPVLGGQLEARLPS